MATIVNYRDVKLQATSPRMITVTLDPGVVVPALKAILFTANSNFFQVNNAGTATPTSITLTATNRQVTGSISFSVVSGTATLTGTGSSSPATRTLTYANMGSNSVTLRASVTDTDGTLYTSDLTIVKVTDGVNGTNGNDGLRGSLVVVSTQYDWRIHSWDDTYANRLIYDALNGLTTTTGLATTTHLRIGDTVTETDNSPWRYTKGTYDNAAAYVEHDLVVYSGAVYRCIKDSTGNLPTNATYWTLWITAVTSRGAWAVSTAYAVNDTVTGLDANGVSTTWVAMYAHTSQGTFASERDGGGFAELRFWTGASWARPGQIIDGALLVRGSVSADAVFTYNLSALSADLGTITAGSITSSSDIDIAGMGRFRGSTTASGFTGAVAANDTGNSAYGVIGFSGGASGAGVLGIGGGSGTAGLRALPDSTGWGVESTASTSGFSGVGVYSRITNASATGTAIKAETSGAGQTALAVVGKMTMSDTTLVLNLNSEMWNGKKWNGVTTGAATATQSLTNKPGASSTNSWLRIDDSAGNLVGYLPIWTT